MERDQRVVVRYEAGDLAGAVQHLYLHKNLYLRNSRFMMRTGTRCYRIQYRIFRSTGVGADTARASEAAGAYEDENTIIVQGFL